MIHLRGRVAERSVKIIANHREKKGERRKKKGSRERGKGKRKGNGQSERKKV
jgi:ribosomal protein L19E